MKLRDALRIVNAPLSPEAAALDVALICGFTPLHLSTFLLAELRTRLSGYQVRLTSGLYGDTLGSLRRLRADPPAAVVAALEWPDLDARLGVRSLGGWGADLLDDIVRSARARLDAITEATIDLAQRSRVVISLPTLPLPPIGHSHPAQLSRLDADLRAALSGFAVAMARALGVHLVSEQVLQRSSPPSARWDVRGELATGFPYQLDHASELARLIAALIHPATPKKGLITDLDDTLWKGIVGDAGASGVAWDLAGHAQIHGLYQQLLSALADSGVLVAVASKNDRALVDEVFARDDVLLRPTQIFPFEVHWSAKSESVTRVLRAWNIGADSVVFVDDSPMELAEVSATHPGVTCIQFPRDDPDALLELLVQLRALFGKDVITDEDRIRQESLRRREQVVGADSAEAEANGEVNESFLREAEGEVTITATKLPFDARAFELVNKTNQFNLNGRRHPEAAWRASLADDRFVLLTLSYRDKFGPLGKIAVAGGHRDGDAIHLETWVMSCRAFARRLEHVMVQQLFERFGVSEIVFDFAPTERNGPLRTFLTEILGAEPAPGARLTRTEFDRLCPPLYHTISDAANA
ncbi:MAG TPA: HAD-IIIC family phosphatase [Gemmatimonadaceae bacterium]|nr:HAD-IIIC family phosphatase [Gemmatimonadaceae bacterium]